MVRAILLTSIFAAVCSSLAVDSKTSAQSRKNASPISFQYGPQRPSPMRSRREAQKVNQGSDIILFPDSVEVDNRQLLPLKLEKPPPCANGLTYCEAVEEYPVDHVARLLTHGASEIGGFFQADLEIQDRIETGEGERLCGAKETIIFPKMAQNQENVWLYIVNQDKYIQGVTVEQCVSPGQECTFASSFPAGYKTECKQKYIYRKLLAVNDSQVVTDSFLLPSCCSCVYRPLDLTNTRMGSPAANAMSATTKKPKPRK